MVAESGANSLYNWFSVLRSDAGGRTVGFIPDGQLCSGGNPGFSGYDLARTDWPLTHLTAGAHDGVPVQQLGRTTRAPSTST